MPDEKVLNSMCPSHLIKDLRSEQITLRELMDWLIEKRTKERRLKTTRYRLKEGK